MKEQNTIKIKEKLNLSLINIIQRQRVRMTELKEKGKQMQIQDKKSQKSSSLISSSRSRSSDSSVSKSKYQKKQLQSSKLTNNDTHGSRSDKKQVPDKIIQKKYNQRSRSHSSKSDRRSRSIKKKEKSKHRNRSRQTSVSFRSKDHKKDKYRTQKYKDRDDRKSYRYRDDQDRDRKYNRDRRDRDDYDSRDRRDRERGRSPDNRNRKDYNKQKDTKQQPIKPMPIQVPMPIEIPMPPIPGERGERRRQRSRSPLSYYRRNQNNNQGEFWDSFSWVPRINYTPNVSSSALVNTKKMRRLMMTNIPYEMGIGKDDLRELITRFMTQNYLKDSMNNCPVRDLELNQEDHSVAVELSSVEETCRMCKLQKIELFKGSINGIIRLGDSCYGNNIVTQAQNAAQAQAAAFAAINVLENKKTSFNMDVNLNKGPEASTLIRVTNAVTTYMIQNMTREEMQDYHEDLIEGFSQYGKIVHNWFVKPSEKDVCANPGDLFIEYESQEEAIRAMNEMQGKFYDERVIKLFYIPRDIYYPNYKKDITPPIIKAPLKKKVEPQVGMLPLINKTSHTATKLT